MFTLWIIARFTRVYLSPVSEPGIRNPRKGNYPKNQKMYVHSEQTKQVADRLAQSNPKNEAAVVFNCASLDQKYLFEHTGQHH